MKKEELRWKISSLIAKIPNHELVDLIFASVPKEHIEEMLRRERSGPEMVKSHEQSAVWLDRSRR